jgi:hypothetical protein
MSKLKQKAEAEKKNKKIFPSQAGINFGRANLNNEQMFG